MLTFLKESKRTVCNFIFVASVGRVWKPLFTVLHKYIPYILFQCRFLLRVLCFFHSHFLRLLLLGFMAIATIYNEDVEINLIELNGVTYTTWFKKPIPVFVLLIRCYMHQSYRPKRQSFCNRCSCWAKDRSDV